MLAGGLPSSVSGTILLADACKPLAYGTRLRCLAAGRFPATGRSPIGRPDAFPWERVTGWSPVGGRVAQWNAPSVVDCDVLRLDVEYC